jgi:hypothetical protein
METDPLHKMLRFLEHLTMDKVQKLNIPEHNSVAQVRELGI